MALSCVVFEIFNVEKCRDYRNRSISAVLIRPTQELHAEFGKSKNFATNFINDDCNQWLKWQFAAGESRQTPPGQLPLVRRPRSIAPCGQTTHISCHLQAKAP